MIKNDQTWLLVKILQTLFARLKSNNLVILPALESIFQQVQNHFIIVNKKYLLTHADQIRRSRD